MSIDFVKAGLIIAWTNNRIRVGEIYPLGDDVTFGREVSMFPGGPLDDTMLSRKHFRMTRNEDGTYNIQDLNSSNGTAVNGSSVNRAVLKDGHWVRVGDTFMVFRRFPPSVPINEMWGMDSMLPSVGPAFAKIRHQARALGPLDSPVAIVGPPGSAKVQIAEQIHYKGDRQGPCTEINCAAPIEDTLVNALQSSRGGTVILRHFNRMSQQAQQILINALAMKFDARFIVTSTRHLDELLGEETALAPAIVDYFSQTVIEVPELNDHIEDMIPWIYHFFRERDDERSLDPTLVNALFTLYWKENYRQLKHIMEVAMEDRTQRLTLSKNVAKELLGVPTLMLSNQISQSFKKTAPY